MESSLENKIIPDFEIIEPELDPRIEFAVNEILLQKPKQITEVDHIFESDFLNIFGTGEKENVIDSRTLSMKIKKCMKALQTETTSNEGRIKIADFICNKLFDIYKLSVQKRDVIIPNLVKAVENGKNIPNSDRLCFLKFKNTEVSYTTAVKLFHNNIRENLDRIPYFQIIKYILRATLNVEINEKKYEKEILDEFDSLFNDDEISIYIKMEIADIFLLNGRTERGNEMLDIIRQEEHLLLQERYPQTSYSKSTVVYKDSQNIHDTEINKSVLQACVRLMELESPSCGFNSKKVKQILTKISPENESYIDTVLERIDIDTSVFSIDNNRFGMHDLFSSLWSFIDKHSSRDELHKRLVEEIVAMSQFCSTGHIGRFINVIQGYTDDDLLHVKISEEQQIHAIISHYLDAEMSNSSDNIIDSMISTDCSPFYDFIVEIMDKKIPDILNKHGDVKKHIISSIVVYTRFQGWEINETGKLFWVK